MDLIYLTGALDGSFIDHIRGLANRAGVGFHLLVSPRDRRLTLDHVEAWIPACKDADIWLWSVGFGDALREAMIRHGLPAVYFHRELFEMR